MPELSQLGDKTWQRLALPTIRFAVRGLLAGLLLALLDVLFCRQALVEQFPSRWLQLRLVGHITSLSMLVLLPLGVSGGWFMVLTDWLISRRKPLHAGVLWAMVAAPLLAWVSYSLFLGGKMQKVPLRSLWSSLIFGLGFSALIQVAPRTRLLWIRLETSVIAKRLAVGVALGGLLLLLHVADRTVLPRLYPWFHGSLLVAQILTAGLIVSLPIPKPPRISHWYVGLTILIGLALWQGMRSLDKLRRAMAMRSVVRESTLLSGRVLDLMPKRARVTPRTTAIADNVERPPSYSGPRLADRDVFLITIDAFRHDRLTPEVTPKMHSLAQHGVRFSRAYTQVPHTSFAVATLLTGKPVYALMQLGHDAGSHKTLPLILRNYRYKTAAFYPPSVFFVEHERLQALEDSAYGFEYVKVEYLVGERRTQQVIDFLESERPERVFAWIHYLEPHEPYDVHPGGPDKSRPDRERYDGEIHHVDQQIARLTEYLAKSRPGALLIFAADHGEEFGEHGGRYHGSSLYDEQSRVPLFMVDTAVPHALLGPATYPQPVGLIDVAPTLLGLLDIEPNLEMRGQNLAPWLLTKQNALPQRAIWSEIGKRKMVVYGDHKLICDLGDDSCQVFDLVRDPGERRNLVDSDPRRAIELRGRLLTLLQEARQYEQAATTQHPTASTGSALAEHAENTLARGRLGDRTALPLLIQLIADPSATESIQREAISLAALLATQAVPLRATDPDPILEPESDAFSRAKEALSTRFLLTGEPEKRRWAAVLLTRLGGQTADSSELLKTLLADAKAPASQRLAAALSQWSQPTCRMKQQQHCVQDSLQVLAAAIAMDEPDQVRPLLRLLGESHDARVTAPLVRQLETVRSRVDVVAALGQLGDERAIPALGKTLLDDPYVHVRVQAAQSLRRLGGPSANAFLIRARVREHEPAVLAALRDQSPP